MANPLSVASSFAKYLRGITGPLLVISFVSLVSWVNNRTTTGERDSRTFSFSTNGTPKFRGDEKLVGTDRMLWNSPVPAERIRCHLFESSTMIRILFLRWPRSPREIISFCKVPDRGITRFESHFCRPGDVEIPLAQRRFEPTFERLFPFICKRDRKHRARCWSRGLLPFPPNLQDTRLSRWIFYSRGEYFFAGWVERRSDVEKLLERSEWALTIFNFVPLENISFLGTVTEKVTM